jgi:hypothetical protein
MDTVPDFDHERDMARLFRLAGMPRQAEWEQAMAGFRDTSPDASVDEKWVPVERICKTGLKGTIHTLILTGKKILCAD